MRGKAFLISVIVIFFRITPAYAGKSVALHLHIGFRRDHPRLCGEKTCSVSCSKAGEGSPPPMRGKGIGGTKPTATMTDHPRLCGEKQKSPEPSLTR